MSLLTSFSIVVCMFGTGLAYGDATRELAHSYQPVARCALGRFQYLQEHGGGSPEGSRRRPVHTLFFKPEVVARRLLAMGYNPGASCIELAREMGSNRRRTVE